MKSIIIMASTKPHPGGKAASAAAKACLITGCRLESAAGMKLRPSGIEAPPPSQAKSGDVRVGVCKVHKNCVGMYGLSPDKKDGETVQHSCSEPAKIYYDGYPFCAMCYISFLEQIVNQSKPHVPHDMVPTVRRYMVDTFYTPVLTKEQEIEREIQSKKKQLEALRQKSSQVPADKPLVKPAKVAPALKMAKIPEHLVQEPEPEEDEEQGESAEEDKPEPKPKVSSSPSVKKEEEDHFAAPVPPPKPRGKAVANGKA